MLQYQLGQAQVMGYMMFLNGQEQYPPDIELVYGSPAATLAAPEDPGLARARYSIGTRSSEILEYRRADLAGLKTVIETHGRFEIDPSVHTLLDIIQGQLGLDIQASDVEDTPVTDNGNQTISFTLTATAESRLWYGSVDITASLKQDISEIQEDVVIRFN